jgi:hypothetical protein
LGQMDLMQETFHPRLASWCPKVFPSTKLFIPMYSNFVSICDSQLPDLPCMHHQAGNMCVANPPYPFTSCCC